MATEKLSLKEDMDALSSAISGNTNTLYEVILNKVLNLEQQARWTPEDIKFYNFFNDLIKGKTFKWLTEEKLNEFSATYLDNLINQIANTEVSQRTRGFNHSIIRSKLIQVRNESLPSRRYKAWLNSRLEKDSNTKRVRYF